MNVKLIAVDMDGTLLDRDHITVPRRNIDALRAAAQRGIKIVIATGRNICLIEDAAADLGVVDYALAANGAGLMDWHTREWLHHVPLPDAQWRAMLEILHRRGLGVETYADGKAFLTGGDLRRVGELEYGSANFADYFVSKVEVVDDVAAAVTGMTVEKLHIFYVPPQEAEGLKAELEKTGPVLFANGDPTNLELTAPGVDKGAVLALLCEKLGITPDEVMAFGDGDNDLEMLSWAGCSFAMANASQSAKAAAKYHAGANYEGGVGQAIEAHVLPYEKPFH